MLATPGAPRVPARALDVAVVVSAVAALSLILGRAALLTYDAFDMSAFMDAGWRVYSGQRPYVDFYYHGGPVHLYLHAVSYAVFGFGKIAVLVHLLAGNAVVLGVAYVIARRRLGVAHSLALAVLSSLAFYGPIAHPWYDQNASLWLVVGALVLELCPVSRPGFVARGAALGGLAAFAFFTKTNVGAAGAGCFLLVLVAGPRRRAGLVGYVLGAAVAAALVLATVSTSDFVDQVFVAARPHARLLRMNQLVDVLLQTPYVLLMALTTAVASMGGRTFIAAHADRFALLGGLLLTSVFTAWTGSMKIAANIVLVGVELTLLAVLASHLPDGPPGSTDRRLRRTAVGGLIACALALLVSAGQKTTDRLVWTWRASNLANDYTLTTPAMRGWRCNRQVCEGIDRSVAWIQAYVPPGESLFVFPDATLVYGLTGRDSWRNAPFAFHLGQQPAPGRRYQQFRASFTAAPPRWILLHNQTEVGFFHTFALLRWLELDRFIATRYRIVWHWNDFAVLRLAD